MALKTEQKPIERMYDLSIEMNNGLWRLQQSDGLDSPIIIDLHPVQIRLLAEHAGFLTALPKPLNNMSASHVRRLNTLHERIEELFFDDSITSEIIECCGNGFDVMNHLRAIHEQIEELVADTKDSEIPENSDICDIKPETHQNEPESDKNV